MAKPRLRFNQPDLTKPDTEFDQLMRRDPDPVRSGFLPEHLAKLAYPDRDERNPAPMDLYSMLTPDESADRLKQLKEREGDKSGLGLSNALASWAGMSDNRSGQAVWDNRASLRDKILKDYDTIAGDRRKLLDDFYKRQVGIDQSDAQKEVAGNVYGVEGLDLPNLPGETAIDVAKDIYGEQQANKRAKDSAKNKSITDSRGFMIDIKDYNKQIEAINKDMTGQLAAAQLIKSGIQEVRSGNKTAWKGIGKSMASFMGEGARTTDEDVRRYIDRLGASGIVEKFNQMANSKPSEENMAEVESIVNRIEEDLRQLRSDKTRNYVKSFQSAYGLTPEQTDHYLNYSRYTVDGRKDNNPQDELVEMIAPNGKKAMVPKSKVNEAISNGGRLANE